MANTTTNHSGKDHSLGQQPASGKPKGQSSRTLLLIVLFALVGWGGYLVFNEARSSFLWSRAEQLIARREFVAALSNLESCLASRPESAEVAFLSARTARRAGDYSRARELLQRSKELSWVENAILLEDSLLKAEQGSFASVESFLINCVRAEHPDSLIILEVITPRYVGSFNYPLASETIEAWKRLDPTSPTPHLEAGRLYTRVGRMNDALTSFQEAYKRDSDSITIRLRVSQSLIERQYYQEALEHLEWLTEKSDDPSLAQMLIARCQAALGDFEKAATLSDQLLIVAPDNSDLLCDRGKLALTVGDPTKAEKFLRRASQIDPFNREIFFHFARCLEQLGKADDAKKAREQTAKIEEAQAKMTQLIDAIAQNPRDAKSRSEAGKLLMMNGQVQAGVMWLETAIEQDPKHLQSHELLADFYARSGDMIRSNYHARFKSMK
jgi:tetratricopeptide (TPR) repeat protein